MAIQESHPARRSPRFACGRRAVTCTDTTCHERACKLRWRAHPRQRLSTSPGNELDEPNRRIRPQSRRGRTRQTRRSRISGKKYLPAERPFAVPTAKRIPASAPCSIVSSTRHTGRANFLPLWRDNHFSLKQFSGDLVDGMEPCAGGTGHGLDSAGLTANPQRERLSPYHSGVPTAEQCGVFVPFQPNRNAAVQVLVWVRSPRRKLCGLGLV